MNNLKIVRGNEFATLTKVKAFKYDGTEIQDFDLAQCANLRVTIHTEISVKTLSSTVYSVLEDNMLKIQWLAKEEFGPHLLEVCGEYENSKWRFFDKEPIFTIVNTNSEANIPPQSIVDEDTYMSITATTYLLNTTTLQGDVSHRIHVGEFNANNLTEEGWYDSIVLGRPECSESDEKYFLYMSSNGGQVCWSRRNSGKSYHRLGLGHPWIATTHDDFSREQAMASSMKVYPTDLDTSITFSGDNIYTQSDIHCQEVYSGDDLLVQAFNLICPIQLSLDDIVEVSCFYRRGNSSEAFTTYPYDSDAYIYISDQEAPGHDVAHLKSDFIKVKSLGSLDQTITSGDYQSLNTAADILSTNCGRHFVKYTGAKSGTFYVHIAGNFSTRSSWLAIYLPGCKVHHASSFISTPGV